MYDKYNFLSIILRSLALVPLIVVLYKHMILMKGVSYRNTKIALLIIFVLTIFNNSFTIFSNFYRADDGNLLDWMRHISQILNSLAALGQAIGWYLLYRDDGEDEK